MNWCLGLGKEGILIIGELIVTCKVLLPLGGQSMSIFQPGNGNSH